MLAPIFDRKLNCFSRYRSSKSIERRQKVKCNNKLSAVVETSLKVGDLTKKMANKYCAIRKSFHQHHVGGSNKKK